MQWATHPAAAPWNTSDITESPGTPTPDKEPITASLPIPAGATRIFMRLRTSLSGP